MEVEEAAAEGVEEGEWQCLEHCVKLKMQWALLGVVVQRWKWSWEGWTASES